MPNELIKEPKGRTITLGGKEYQLSPLNLNVMVAIEEEFDCNLPDLGKLFSNKKTKQLTVMSKLIYILLKENYPKLTQVELGKMVIVDNLAEISDAVGKILAGE